MPSAFWKVAVRWSAWRACSTLLCESMRAGICPAMMSVASSFSSSITGVLKASAIRFMSTVTCTAKGRRNRRLWRRLARAPEAVAGRPVGWPLPFGSAAPPKAGRAPEEARGPSSGATKGSACERAARRRARSTGRAPCCVCRCRGRPRGRAGAGRAGGPALASRGS
eukprot:scaffold3336_cov66-Phaeocystis_antarctica.AAC.1